MGLFFGINSRIYENKFTSASSVNRVTSHSKKKKNTLSPINIQFLVSQGFKIK